MTTNQKLFVRSVGDAELFVTTAYKTLLARQPDPTGLALYVASLVDGHMTPAELIQVIQDSPEARAKAVDVTPDTLSVRMGGSTYQVHGNKTDPYYRDSVNAESSFAIMGKVLSRFCPEDAQVVDIGANIGLSAMFFSSLLPRSRVLALEPSRRNFQYLKQNLSQNNLSMVSARQVAASNQVGTLRLHEEPDFGAGSYVVSEQHSAGVTASPIEVEAKPLDQVVAEERLERVDFIKIDVEGSELDVLDGMQDTVRRFKPIIFMEINTWALIAWRNLTPRTLLNRFIELCPRAFSFTDGELVSISSPQEQHHFLFKHLVQKGCMEDVVGCPVGGRLPGS